MSAGKEIQATIRPAIVAADELAGRLDAFAKLLHACVHAGASVNFVMPFPEAEARAFWERKVLPAVRDGTRVLLAAESGGKIVGTVQLALDMPPNQPHRAEISKLLVDPAFRRRGIARALMAAAESEAAARGRSLLTLDTRTGDHAEPLYASLGYVTAGTIPGYCRDPSADRLDATTIMYKRLNVPAALLDA
ncbi:GNAT family N-acetyltransferase [Faunimonas sp. B44]|uniref:GNAT family N-acetyltransferase n=1 Tax=Faunimonas sp. B44 TaxID=3461493 RepID=UPI0040439772